MKQHFLKHYLKKSIVPLFLYGWLSTMGAIIDLSSYTSIKYNNQKSPLTIEALSNHARGPPSGSNVIYEIVLFPWKNFGFLTTQEYDEVYNLAITVAQNVDNTRNPQSVLLTKLGYAMRISHNTEDGIYIAFKNLKEFIEINSNYEMDDLREFITLEKAYHITLGKAYFKADKDRDGYVDRFEWSSALHQMGYNSLEHDLLGIVPSGQDSTTGLGKSLEGLIEKHKELPIIFKTNSPISLFPAKIPLDRLSDYIKNQ